MKSVQALSLLALASITIAAPQIFPYPVCTQYNDSYDNLATNAVTPPAVGNYNGLTYAGFIVDGQGPAGNVDGVVPHSSPNVASATLQQDEQTFGSVILNPYGTISTGPGTRFFSLINFYYGCSSAAPPGAGVAQGCTISVVGVDNNGNQLQPLTFSYAPTNALNAQMIQASLPSSYYYLSKVTFGITTSSGPTPGSYLHLDNLVHCNFS